jgi:hypothetical protein
MAAIMPYKARVPRFGHNVTVTFGEPLQLDDITCKCNKKGYNQEKVWQEITQRVRASLLVRTCICNALLVLRHIGSNQLISSIIGLDDGAPGQVVASRPKPCVSTCAVPVCRI